MYDKQHQEVWHCEGCCQLLLTALSEWCWLLHRDVHARCAQNQQALAPWLAISNSRLIVGVAVHGQQQVAVAVARRLLLQL